MNRDLGTYHVRVELEAGRGFIFEFDTGARYQGGSGGCHPLDAKRIGPIYESEEDLLRNIDFMFTDGNYSCDCNLLSFIARSNQAELDEEGADYDCGDTLKIKRLTAIRPDGSECVLVPS